MKRVVLLLAVITTLLQWSYSIAGQYCAHDFESGAHWGHHFHHHTAEVPAPESGKSKSPPAHNDCSFCHVSTASAATSVLALPVLVQQASLNAVPLTALQGLPPDAPERPNWRD